MANIKIITSLDGPQGKTDLECQGILLNNKIEYISENVLTKISIDEQKIIIARRSQDYELKITLEENQTINGSLVLYKRKILTMPVKTKSLKISDKEIQATYHIDEIGEFVYKIKYEVE